MGRLKWFSVGEDRRREALTVIGDLVSDLSEKTGNQSLHNLLTSYRDELESEGASTPFILSRLNLDISRLIREEGISLSKEESKQLTKLRQLLTIRYGY